MLLVIYQGEFPGWEMSHATPIVVKACPEFPFPDVNSLAFIKALLLKGAWGPKCDRIVTETPKAVHTEASARSAVACLEGGLNMFLIAIHSRHGVTKSMPFPLNEM